MDIFHRHRQAGEHGSAAAALERALQVPEYRPEAFIWKGIEALPKDPKLAFVFLGNAAESFPQRADVHALLGRSLIAQGQSALATRYLSAIWQKMPSDPALRMQLWQARSQSETCDDLRRIILAHLPEITAGQELSFVLKLLIDKAQYKGSVGVVRYLQDTQEIQGWAVDLGNVQTVPTLQLEANGRVVSMAANAPHPLLAAAGLPASHGGIRIKVPNAMPAVHVRFDAGPALLGSPVHAMPAFVPPPPSTEVGMHQPVDVLIPVYNGLEETLECLNSAIEARKLNRTPHRLVVIEDASPVPALRKALKVLAGKGKITLVHNAVNLGFIRSMNRAMALSPSKDVVWLNADTRVHGDWLDRLREVAYRDGRTASVTPFTNNGELMSFPRSQISHPMPSAAEQAELDDLARQAASAPMEIETGCGFCLYIKREALHQVGYLDEVHLARGYGEETDWCLRARNLGWHHLGAPNVFVAHQGGISFGAEKILRVAHNNAILRQRYPDASARYKVFCLRDPIKPARDALQRARLVRLAEQASSRRQPAGWPAQGKKTLHVHDGSNDDAPFSLAWQHDTHRTWVTLRAPLAPLPLILDYQLPQDFASLVEALRLLPQDELVFERLADCPAELCDLPALLDTPYRILCRDQRLLSQDGSHDWQRFAREASSIQLPWNALTSAYAAALPGSHLLTQATRPLRGTPAELPRVFLIGDALREAEVGQQWLTLARNLARSQRPTVLLAKEDAPWLKTLQATGIVQLLPEVQGFTFAQRAKAAGCQAVLSLTDAPDAGWPAPELAAELDVPLYAKPTSLADEVGATPITHLPFY